MKLGWFFIIKSLLPILAFFFGMWIGAKWVSRSLPHEPTDPDGGYICYAPDKTVLVNQDVCLPTRMQMKVRKK